MSDQSIYENLMTEVFSSNSNRISDLVKIASLDIKRDLVGADFSRCELQGDNLKRYNLLQCNFSHSDLRRGLFSFCCITNADFYQANLESAVLTNVEGKHANFIDANMEDTDFTGSDLQYASFRNAQLNNACFRHANLSYADFRGSTAEYAFFESTNIYGSLFDKTILTNARFINNIGIGTGKYLKLVDAGAYVIVDMQMNNVAISP